MSIAALLLLSPVLAQSGFVNWESPHVHPLDLSSDGSLLVAVNTADARLELFDASGPQPVPLGAVPVGLDPVSVRLRSANEAWVVNHLSDSVSVVDLSTRNVIATLSTDDEPCDVVFAGDPERAFVTCSQANSVLVFDPSNLAVAPVRVMIGAEDPRALAVSADGSRIFVGIFESGNGSTALGGGATLPGTSPPNVVNHPSGPYGGQNPPPNAGAGFVPPITGGLPVPPRVGLIVKKDASGAWMDDNGGDWTALVSGANAGLSGRPVGWDLPDRDVAIIDVATLTVSYATRMMNHCMALAVNPATTDLAVVGTDAINEVRFEPNLNGVFVRVQISFADAGGATLGVFDLNTHLDYTQSTVPQGTRDESLGDPRGIVWSADGNTGYVSGMGSNNLIVIDSTGSRAGLAPTIEVGEGPTGLALDDAAGRLYVLDRFEGALSVVDTTTELESARVSFYDPTPAAIRNGRVHLYGTHETSGLGHVSCGSCHVDARMDRLAWDLGDPSGAMKPFLGNCPDGGCQDWHPMKGPMLTQTMQDIIGKEPHHWRGDRTGIEEFNAAFEGLLGDDQQLTPVEMQEFEDFLASLYFPPNPFRELDNALPDDLVLNGHFTTGRFGPAGQPLPNGDATRGLFLSRPPNLLDQTVACVTCHTLPTGLGTDYMPQGTQFVPIPPGPDGERHHGLVSVDGSTNISIKIPQLRNLYERVGFEFNQSKNVAGFGFLHDGSVDSLARFVSEPVFSVTSDQDVADLVALMLAFSGSDLPQGSTTNPLEPPGSASQDSHAAVGVQVTITDGANIPPGDAQLVTQLLNLADGGAIGLVVKGRQAGEMRGAVYVGLDLFQTDRELEMLSTGSLLAGAAAGNELTYTAVPEGTQWRIGVDRDSDGFLDRDELDGGSDPADPGSIPLSGTSYCFGDGNGTPCPCANDDVGGLGGCANSSGSGALLSVAGIPSAAHDSASFQASNLNPGQPGLLFQGDNALNGGAGILFGDGLRCAGGSVVRLAVLVPDIFGDVLYPGPGDDAVSVAGGVQAGDTKRYQLWYRDPNGGPCATGFNLTNGVEIAWQ